MDATAVVAVLLFCMMIGLFALAQLEKTQTRLERVVVENARLTANFQAEQFQRLYDLVDDVNETWYSLSPAEQRRGTTKCG